ncbi:isoprenylcysteine carboxylmethyltransferase family protein [Candidatus Bathyarchaeota archaeon]|nr:isoprenylcysteine carboxylmethyltransferase family protein [Candidatus Bathyarchaeota archaeon]
MENIQEKGEKKFSFFDILVMTLPWLAIIAQIVLTFALWGNYYGINPLLYIGYALWGIGGLFGLLPILHFRRKGGVKKGDSYVKTTSLVTTGLYSIVRHPQYLSGIIISLALAFMSQHWVVVILVIPPLVCTYFDTFKAEIELLEKFGEEYVLYKKQVPRLYPLFGILKLTIRKFKQRNENRRKEPNN